MTKKQIFIIISAVIILGGAFWIINWHREKVVGVRERKEVIVYTDKIEYKQGGEIKIGN